jgi:hypothetical protein
MAPGQLLSALADGSSGTAGYAHTLAVRTANAAVVALGTLFPFQRRDV